jgi:hypothetical protein
MNHQPFEEWLLNTTPLTAEQKRQLDSHVRSCTYCAALARTEKILRTVRLASPASGFVTRFQTRLAAQKVVDRRRRQIGSILFTFGAGFLAVISLPYLVFSSPAVIAACTWGICSPPAGSC